MRTRSRCQSQGRSRVSPQELSHSCRTHCDQPSRADQEINQQENEAPKVQSRPPSTSLCLNDKRNNEQQNRQAINDKGHYQEYPDGPAKSLQTLRGWEKTVPNYQNDVVQWRGADGYPQEPGDSSSFRFSWRELVQSFFASKHRPSWSCAGFVRLVG